MSKSIYRISKVRRRFRGDRLVLSALILCCLALGFWSWLGENPQHNPWAPLDLSHPAGWTTAGKITALRADTEACRAVLARSEVEYSALPAQGSGSCARPDRTVLEDFRFSGRSPVMTCPVAVGLHLWMEQVVQPAAEELLGSDVKSVTQLGTYSCRRMYGSESGRWSEHATGNAIDIAGFTLNNGKRISVLADWDEGNLEGQFLRRVRDGGCGVFGTVLSPDYNAAHRDHFHFDQTDRRFGVCR